ncbi:MAG TPA: PASTA domain-containing protein [Chthoniobacterales bacterium]
MATNRIFTDDELNNEIAQILPVADRLRLVALDRVQSLAAAKTRSLQRELRIVQALHPDDADRISQATRRVELQQTFATQTTAEVQRGEVSAPLRNPAALILFGRVTDRDRLGKPGLIVSATGAEGRAVAFTCTDDNGNFRLDVPVSQFSSASARSVVTLLVSDSQQAILYRGTEVFPVEGNKVIYREIVLGDEPGKPTPQPPPPVPEQVIVPEVVGNERSSAIALLKRTGLLADEQFVQVEADKVGLVVVQDPKAGTSVTAGSLVTITVGIAGETVAVPDVVGTAFAEAAAALKRVQLRLGAVEPPNPGNDAVVLDQSPKAGTQVARGSFVDLKVRPPVTEPPTVEVPDLSRLTLDEAREKIEAQKLKLGSVTPKPTTDNQVGLILSQSPKAGENVAPGSAVDIVIGEREGGSSGATRTAAEAIRLAAREPDFEKVGATEAKLLRIAEDQNLRSENDLRKIAETGEDAEVRDRFKLRNIDQARAFREILMRVMKRV